MKIIAIIPARSGSKGLPDKNIKLLNGKPLLAWTIEAAKNSGLFDEIMVSTDSEKYAEIAMSYGASVPFLRSAENSNDTAGSWDVVREVLQAYKDDGREFDALCLLQPTSPLRTSDDIHNASDILRRDGIKAVVSVCECEHSPLWTNTLPGNQSMADFITEASMQQRQRHETYYRLNGAIYFWETESFLRGDKLYSEGTQAYVMATENSVDIDNKVDFMLAEAIIREKSAE